MNPEQARLAALFQERERMVWEQHKKEQAPTPAELKERQKAHRAEQLRLFLMRNYPNESAAEAEAHLCRLLGDPEPVKRPAKAARSAQIRKPAPAKMAPVPVLYAKMNKRIAAGYGLELPAGSPLQYR